MTRALLLAVLALSLPALAAADEPKKTCDCSERCTCGCNAGEPCRCARPGKPAPAAPVEDKPIFGVDAAKLKDRPARILRGGKEITREQAFQLLGDKEVPDDRSLLRVTVIGPDAERGQVVADLAGHPALASYKGRLLVQDYAPDHWSVARAGFKTDGHPTVYVQAPDGTVLHRQDTYQGPAQLAEAIRKADPSYDPSKDPDATKPAIGLPDLSKIPTWVWVAGAVGLYMFLQKKGQ